MLVCHHARPQKFLMNDFTLLCFLYSALALFTSIRNKFFPPKTYGWYRGVQIKEALLSEDSWQKANHFVAIPLVVASIVFLLIGFLPIFFSQSIIFSFTTVSILITTSNLIIMFRTKKHLKGLFDEHGNRKINA